MPPLTPPARCAAPAGVRKAPAPFRPASERFAATTVEEILAKMEQPRKEVPASPDRLWGSRLTFNQDGSSRYGSRTYGVAPSPREADGRTLSREQSQEGPAKPPAECPGEPSKTPEERNSPSDLAFNGDLAAPASSEPPTDVSKPLVPLSPGPTLENGDSAAPAFGPEASGPALTSPHLYSPDKSSHQSPLPEPQSPGVPGASPCLPKTPASPTMAPPGEGSCHLPSLGLPVVEPPEAPRPGSPLLPEVLGHHSSEQPPAASPQPLTEGGELLNLPRTFPSGEVAATGDAAVRPVTLAHRRFSEGVLRPPGQDQEKLGGSLAALPQTQGSQSALDRPFGSGTESNWSLSQSFEWTFPTRPSGLGVWRLDSPPPSPITEASEAAEAAAASAAAAVDAVEAGHWGGSSREEGLCLQGPGALAAPEGPGAPAAPEGPGAPAAPEGPGVPAAPEEPGAQAAPEGPGAQAAPEGPGAQAAPEGPGRPGSWVQVDDLGTSSTQKGDEESHPQSPSCPLEPLSIAGDPPGPVLLQAEERYEEPELLAGQESPLPLATREAALPILEPILGQQHPAPPDQPCVLFVDTPDPGQALPAKEGAMTLARAETTQPRTEVQDPCRASPEPAGPESSSRWLDDLLASPPPSAGGARRGAGSERKDAQTPGACSEGLLGWAQKDLQSEFGIAADPHPSQFSPSGWSQDTSQDYSLGSTSPRGDLGLRERDWTSQCGQGVGEGSSREWASRCGIGQEEMQVSHPDGSGASAPGGLMGQDWEIGKPAQPGTPQGQEVDVQAWEFRKRDSQGSYCSRDVALQDQEFRKRDSLGTCSSRDMGLQDWEFGKRDCLGAYTHRDEDEQSQKPGKKDQLGGYSSQDADQQDQEFGKSDSSLSVYSGHHAEQLDQDFGKSAWMGSYGGRGSPEALGSQDRSCGTRVLSAGFSPEEAQQQDEEFEKKLLRGRDSPGEASRDAGWPEKTETGGLFGPSSPQSQDGALGQRDRSNWQGSGASQEVGGLRGRQQAGDLSPGDAHQEDRGAGQRGWASDFSLGVVPQPEVAFSPRPPDWSSDFSMEAAERSLQFGIIGNDRASGAGLSPSCEMGGGPFVPPTETLAGTMDWSDQLGLRNLDVSSCVGSGGSSEGRQDAVGQMGWADNLGLKDVEPAGRLETGGSEEPRGTGLGEKDWTSEVGVRGRDLAAAGEVGGHGHARESGVGQTDWSGVEAGEFLKSRDRGVGQADWTPDLGLRDRELGAGQGHWGDSLGLRNLEVPRDFESEGSQGPRGCGVGQMDWTQDAELQDAESPGAPSEAREHGVGEVSQSPEPGLRNTGVSSPGLDAREPSGARELGVGETSGPETQRQDHTLPAVETCPEDHEMDVGESPGFRASLGGCPARSSPSGSQALLEAMLAASSSKAAARRESAGSGPRDLLEEEGATAGADQGESLEPGRDPLPSGGLSLMVKPAGQKRWMAPGPLPEPGRASRARGGSPRARPPAPPVRISPSSRTLRSSTVPCIGAVPTWGASVGTGPRPSGPGGPWVCRRRQNRTRGSSRTPQAKLRSRNRSADEGDRQRASRARRSP
uniref:182 kDa tankyrase-1-binding protein n=1 Tax=Sus scrofa TaxID=9823 RepID=A0A4X1VPC9_PIG